MLLMVSVVTSVARGPGTGHRRTRVEMDVFISYSSSRDKDWVRGELVGRIEEAGLHAFIDYRDFTRGASSIREMERGVVEARKTLLVLTPDYVQNEYAEIESIRCRRSLPPIAISA
jgi:TIR domain